MSKNDIDVELVSREEEYEVTIDGDNGYKVTLRNGHYTGGGDMWDVTHDDEEITDPVERARLIKIVERARNEEDVWETGSVFRL